MEGRSKNNKWDRRTSYKDGDKRIIGQNDGAYTRNGI